MMRISGAVAVAVAALLVCCSADPHQEQDAGEHSGDRYDTSGQKPRNLDPLGGGNLVRDLRESRLLPYLMARRYEYGSPYGIKRDLRSLIAPMEYREYYGEGLPKHNLDEIERSNANMFVKRNFDEIDQTSMPFPFKRFYHLYGSNYLDSPVYSSNLDKKRYRPDYPMDEIDLSQFPIGSKRSEHRL